MKGKLIIILLASLLSSCDYFTDQKVQVIDKQSRMPIKDATVFIAAYDFQTDSSGFCHLSQVTGDLTERKIKVIKEGYNDFSLTVELVDDFISYKQLRDSIFSTKNSFAVLADTLVVYMEKK